MTDGTVGMIEERNTTATNTIPAASCRAWQMEGSPAPNTRAGLSVSRLNKGIQEWGGGEGGVV